jgi:hypothetical protein
MPSKFKARLGFDANNQTIVNLADATADTDAINLQTMNRLAQVTFVDDPDGLPAPSLGFPIAEGRPYLILKDRSGEILHAMVVWNELVPGSDVVVQTGQWVRVAQNVWDKQLAGDPDRVLNADQNDTQYTLELNKEEIKIYDTTVGGWVTIYSTKKIRELVASTSFFLGTVVEDGNPTPGAFEFADLPDLTTTDPDQIDRYALLNSHYFIFTGTPAYLVVPTDPNGIGRDLAGALLNPGDWIEIINRGTPAAPVMEWVLITGDLLTKARADLLYGINDWRAGSYERGSVVNYLGSLYRSAIPILPAEGPPASNPILVGAPPASPAATWTAQFQVDFAALESNPSGRWALANAAGLTGPVGGPFAGVPFTTGDRFVWMGTANAAISGVTAQGQLVSNGWIRYIATDIMPIVAFTVSVENPSWAEIELSQIPEVPIVLTESNLPTTGRNGELYLVGSHSRNSNKPTLVAYGNQAGRWNIMGTAVSFDAVKPTNPQIADIYRRPGAGVATEIWDGAAWRVLSNAVSITGTAPTNPISGDMYRPAGAGQITNIWDGTDWRDLSSSTIAGLYTTGASYAPGTLVQYDSLIFKVNNAIVNAPAAPDHSKWQVYGLQEAGYWQGTIAPTEANWLVNNWVQLATVPAYWVGTVEITALVASADSSYLLSVTTSYNKGEIGLTGSSEQGAGMFTQFRLSATGNAQPVRLEGKIASASKPSPMKILIRGSRYTVNNGVSTVTIPNPPIPTAGGNTIGGNQYAIVDSNIREYLQVKLDNGDVNSGSNNKYQLAFGYGGTFQYPHYIASRHNGAATNIQNAIDFYVSDGTQNPATPQPNTNTIWAGAFTAKGISIPAGSASSPSLNFGNKTGGYDADSGIYSQADGVLSITLNGTERFRFESDRMQMRDGTAGAPVISFFNDSDSGFYKPYDGQIGLSINGTRRHIFDGSDHSFYASGWDSGHKWYSHTNSGGVRDAQTFRDANGRGICSVGVYTTGNYVGGSNEGQWIISAMCGGWGWKESFKTTINSPSGIYIGGDSSAVSHTNRCSITTKRNVGEVPVPSLLDELKVTTYKLIQPESVDKDGKRLRKQIPSPYCEQTRVGFIAEELAANPVTRSLVNHADNPEEMGVDLGQLLAVAVKEIQDLKKRVAELGG